jgi:hypothetical protein
LGQCFLAHPIHSASRHFTPRVQFFHKKIPPFRIRFSARKHLPTLKILGIIIA